MTALRWHRRSGDQARTSQTSL